MATGEYTEANIRLAKEFSDFVVGFICSRKLTDDPKYLYFTPGVQLEDGKDALGQQYTTPQHIIGINRSDIIIVGRAIYNSSNPSSEAKKYKEAGWNAYLQRLST
jgi:uridine monophosphate synthetase